MNLNELIQYFENIDDNAGSRRKALKELGMKAAALAIPFAAATLTTKKASAQSKETLILKLNYLLKLEYIIQKMYKVAFDTNGLLLSELIENYERIVANNKAHIETLRNIVTQLGGTAYTIDEDDIDLTGGYGTNNGPFIAAYDTRANFQVLAQFFADGASRMYKGQVFEVLSDKITVQALMNIHSVKTREATFVRYMRWHYDGQNDLNPWITGTNTNTSNTAVQRAYAGEAVTSQNNINLVGINGFDQVDVDVATEAFDEPLNRLDGEDILNRFIKL